MIVTLLHPGEMGASLGACARAAGHEVRWVRLGRSAATADRARSAGLIPCADLPEALHGCDVILSVCPPAAAIDLAATVVDLQGDALYVDANAISPASARRIAEVVGPERYVDGGIVGPPALRSGTTRLFLSGDHAAAIADVFAGSVLTSVLIEGGAGAASAVKMAYAAWTKGSAALLLAIRALAEREGVAGPLLEEWQRSQPGVAERSVAAATGTPRKAWRFVGEMEEIAGTFREAGLPGDFHAGARDVYARLAGFKNEAEVPLDAVLRALLDG